MADTTEDMMARESVRKRERRRLAFGLNTAVSLVLAALLAGMVNYLSARHYQAFDWSRAKFYSLSDKTVSLLGSLTNRMDVVVLFEPGHPLYEHIDNLLKEYERVSPRIRVQRVDPDRDLGQTEEVARRFNIAEKNVVLFSCGERTKTVTALDMEDMDYSGAMQGGRPEMTAFKGEQAFSSAIDQVTRGRVPVVYFLEGDGEGDIESRDTSTGYSDIGREVVHDNAEVRILKLAEKQAVPDDADAVVIAGATKRIPQSEVDLLRKYLERNGRMVVLLSAVLDPGLEELLTEWGIRVGNDVVVDPTHTLSGVELFLDGYGKHPVTRNLKGLTTVFYMPRSVEPVAAATGVEPQADKPRVEALLTSTDASWAETDREQKPMRFDPTRDRKGPICVGVAAEKGSVANLDVEIRPTRLVVLGDSDFVSNFAALSGANADLFLNALNWVLERQQLLAISPKTPQESRLLMDDVQLQLLFWSIVVGLPGVIAIIGSAVWFRRRS